MGTLLTLIADSKLGRCMRCMKLSLVLLGVSIIALLIGTALASEFFNFMASMAVGGFGTLSTLHLTAYLIRKTHPLKH